MTTTTTTTTARRRAALLAELAATREVTDAAREIARLGRHPLDGLADDEVLRGVLRLRDAVRRTRQVPAIPAQRSPVT